MDEKVISRMLRDMEAIEANAGADQNKAAYIREYAEQRGYSVVLERFLRMFGTGP